MEDYVEVNADGKVTVCRDCAKGKCARNKCKFYHIPILATSTAAAGDIVGTMSGCPSIATGNGLLKQVQAPLLTTAWPATATIIGGAQPQQVFVQQQAMPNSLDPGTLALLLAAAQRQQQYAGVVASGGNVAATV
jgi:hypothetical protein